jgi:hypothetical protein
MNVNHTTQLDLITCPARIQDSSPPTPNPKILTKHLSTYTTPSQKNPFPIKLPPPSSIPRRELQSPTAQASPLQSLNTTPLSRRHECVYVLPSLHATAYRISIAPPTSITSATHTLPVPRAFTFSAGLGTHVSRTALLTLTRWCESATRRRGGARSVSEMKVTMRGTRPVQKARRRGGSHTGALRGASFFAAR